MLRRCEAGCSPPDLSPGPLGRRGARRDTAGDLPGTARDRQDDGEVNHGALTPIEKLAVLLFTTYQFKSGEIYRGTEWTFTMNPDLHAMAAWKWSLLGRDAKDVWLALATQA